MKEKDLNDVMREEGLMRGDALRWIVEYIDKFTLMSPAMKMIKRKALEGLGALPKTPVDDV